MTICDAIGDALMVQASRLDPEHGADDLNSVTQMGLATGGIIGCSIAGFLEYSSVTEIDPNLFFGLYTFLITIMTISVAALSKNMEPEIVHLQIEAPSDSPVHDDFHKNIRSTFSTVCKRMRHTEI